jgi:cytochrome P450
MNGPTPVGISPGDAEQLLASLLIGDTDGDPYDGFRRLRQLAPVLRTGTGTVVLSEYENVDAALRHRDLGKVDEAFSMHLARLPEDQARQAKELWRSTILFNNPPAHTRLRRLISEAFTRRHIERMRSDIAANVDVHLDRLGDRPSVDFMEEIAFPFPMGIIADVLGIPVADRAGFAAIARDMGDLIEPSAPAGSLARAVAVQDQLAGYFSRLLADKRRGDDLLSRLAASRAADALNEIEMIATAIMLFAAGFETTTNLMGNGMYALLTHPDQLAVLRRRPELVPRAVEEFLRFDPPVQLASRTALRPCTVAGIDVVPGQVVLLMLAAANRDPARFTDPDTFDVARDQGPSLAFSSGIHFCLGAHLARLEAIEFFDRLLRRFPVIEPAGRPRRKRGRTLRGFEELPVRVR